MKLIPLSDVSRDLKAGEGLPWNIRDDQGTLLLSKGYMVADADAREAILNRGMFVDAAEAAVVVYEPVVVKAEVDLPSRWTRLEARLGAVLNEPVNALFLERIDDVVTKVAELAQDDPNQLIFLIVQHDHAQLAHYGVTHSLHAAALASFVTARMGWQEPLRRSAIGAALTMNLSIVTLQGRLAMNSARPNDKERQRIHSHPTDAAQLLRKAGLTDEKWLTAVEQHHETPMGTGYPAKITQPSPMAQLLRVVDCYTAKHSPRAGRRRLASPQAARDIYTQNKGDPVAGILVKELGLYPPGSYVRLANGETAVVTHRGPTPTTPQVATVVNKIGEQLSHPISRDTTIPTQAIQGPVSMDSIKVKLPIQSFFRRPKA